MEQEEGSTRGVIKRFFLRRNSIPSSLNFLAMENQGERASKRLGNMLGMSFLL